MNGVKIRVFVTTHTFFARLQVPTVVTLQIHVFWEEMLCHYRGRSWSIKGTMILWNIGNKTPCTQHHIPEALTQTHIYIYFLNLFFTAQILQLCYIHFHARQYYLGIKVN